MSKLDNLINDFVKENEYSNYGTKITDSDLNKVEKVTGVRLSYKMRQLIIKLSGYDLNSSNSRDQVSITCKSLIPGTFELFGMMKRTTAIVGYPISELGNINDYKRYLDSLDDLEGYSSDGSSGTARDLYPCPLFDSFDDGHILICIDYKGRVVEFIYEGDEDDCSILANSQDEFVDKLYLSK